jgi:hypothetical protein
MLIATASILLVNRLLPTEFPGRASWEEGAFWFSWALALVHALVRGGPVERAQISPAWREQCRVFAVLAFAAVVANWIGTDAWIWKTVAAGNWPVAGLDLALIAAGTMALAAARALRRRETGLAASVGTPLQLPEAGSA